MSARNLAATALQTSSARLRPSPSPGASVVEHFRAALRGFAAWRRRRRDHKELLEFLASDHRVAADIGYPHRKE
jgi:uncharacterized protein YjiS (DUF1127 family)